MAGNGSTMTCSACAMPIALTSSLACPGPEGFRACNACFQFVANANLNPQLKNHEQPPKCAVSKSMLSVRSCGGCLYQRCCDVHVDQLVLSITMPFALFNTNMSQPSSAPSQASASTTKLPLPEIPIATPKLGAIVSMVPTAGATSGAPPAKSPKLEAASTAGPAALVTSMPDQGAHSAAQLLASLRNTPVMNHPSPASPTQALSINQESKPVSSTFPLEYMPQSRAMSAPATVRRGSRQTMVKGRRGSCRGFCLGCWKSKELEERYALGNQVKFMLCNACRKTHLTKTVIPKFEQIARQPPQAVDRATQLRIRNSMAAAWTASSKECTSTRLLDMWLNLDWRRVILNGVCGYIPGEELAKACAAAVRQEPNLPSLESDGEENKTPEGSYTMHPRFIRVAGHLHSVTLPRCAVELLSLLRKTVLQGVKILVDQAAQDAIANNGDLAFAMQRHGLKAEEVVLHTEDCVVLFEA
eukprot:m.119515 g.119515  ORF g.119515 m.119515 type:complete len:472 (-) comp15596_c0_seq2:136-1551(-)